MYNMSSRSVIFRLVLLFVGSVRQHGRRRIVLLRQQSIHVRVTITDSSFRWCILFQEVHNLHKGWAVLRCRSPAHFHHAGQIRRTIGWDLINRSIPIISHLQSNGEKVLTRIRLMASCYLDESNSVGPDVALFAVRAVAKAFGWKPLNRTNSCISADEKKIKKR